jgi:hypothetical protein
MTANPLARIFVAVTFCAMALTGCGGGGITTVGGNVSGLVAGTAVTLRLNGRESLAVAANGSFQFSTELGPDDRYDVAIVIQPSRATCTVSNGSGTIDKNASRVANVNVVCVPGRAVGGVVSGLPAGTSVTLQNNGADPVVVANGPFSFPTLVPTGSSYNVAVLQQPSGRTCTVTQASGTVQAVDVTSVVVTCT